MSDTPKPAPTELSVAILIVSTTAAKDPSTDASTKVLTEFFAEASKTSGAAVWVVKDTKIVGDVAGDIQHAVSKWADAEKHSLIVTTGGTGFATSDVTPEAVKPLLEKEAPGLVHAMLSASLAITPFAMMSRPTAGVRGQSIIITIPGSPKGAKENLESIIKLLPHACIQASGAVSSRALHSPGLHNLEKQHNVATSSTPTPGSPSHHHHHDHHHHDHHHHGHSHSHDTHQPPQRLTTPSQRSTATPTSVTLRPRHSPYPTLTLEEATSIITTETQRTPIITLRVTPSLTGHVLAADLHAPESVPPFRASIVDGYALHHTDGPGTYPVISISHAAPNVPLPALPCGSITRITTGAPLPPGATAVVMVEDTLLRSTTSDGTEELTVEILAPNIPAGANIREPGSDILAASLLLRAGTIFSPSGAELAQLAAVGIAQVNVFAKPTIGIMSTGNELVPLTTPAPLKHGQIRDSNRPALLTLFGSLGFPTEDLGITPDTSAALTAALEGALEKVDILITSGGVSMGELDLLKPTLISLGATLHFGRIAMKPGKPTTFATLTISGRKKLIFALPGNPASALTTAMYFGVPAARKSAGWGERAAWVRVGVKAAERWECGGDGRRELRRVVVSAGREGLVARQTGGQRSSRVGSMVGNGVVDLEGGRGAVKVGEKVEAVLWGELVME